MGILLLTWAVLIDINHDTMPDVDDEISFNKMGFTF